MMTTETLLWIAGVGLPLFVAAQGYLVYAIRRLAFQHDNPDKTGFGTMGLNEVIRENTTATRELTHYVRWLGHQQLGTEPPPPLPVPA